jgi:hypothetical protein
VNLDRLRFPLRPPPSAFIVIAPNEFFLLGVYGDHGIALLQESPNLVVEVMKLTVPIEMVRAFLQRLQVGLQAVTHLRQQSAHGVSTDRISFFGEDGRQLLGALTVHNSGDIGSPRVLDSTNCFSRFRIRGFWATILFRPPP